MFFYTYIFKERDIIKFCMDLVELPGSRQGYKAKSFKFGPQKDRLTYRQTDLESGL